MNQNTAFSGPRKLLDLPGGEWLGALADTIRLLSGGLPTSPPLNVGSHFRASRDGSWSL